MGHQQTAAELPPHVLIFPLPLQGHVNSMLKLAELLCLSNLHVTIILSEYTHGRLRRHGNTESHFSRYPGFRVATIPDGLPPEHPRNGASTAELVLSLKKVGEFEFRRLMESTDALSDGGARRRVSCLILDGVMNFVVPVVEEMGIPFIYFRTVGACGFWANFRFREIIEAGEVPLKRKDEDKYDYLKRKDLDLTVVSVPGMEGFLRRRDLPSFCRVDNVGDPHFQNIIAASRHTALSSGLILNTFEDLEGPIMDQIRKPIPNVYSIGPLHHESSTQFSSSFWDEDRSCLTWLDSQPANSVIYVSFGSLTMLNRVELLEFWHGLVNSGQKFLWVMRHDSITGNDDSDEIPVELEEGTKKRGYMVEWVPQHEVLAHPAVAAFFTHSGWNSTLESIVAGIPMLCWPTFSDQMINSRFVSEVWKVGLDMKDTCDRGIVERMVREIVVERRDEFSERARLMAKLAKKAISDGGTSIAGLNRLIEFIKTST